MRTIFLKNMMGVSIISLAILSSVSITSLTFSAFAIAKAKAQSSQAPTSSTMDRTANVQNRLLNLLEAYEEYTLVNGNPNSLKRSPKITVAKQGLKNLEPHTMNIRGRTANVEKKLMRLVNGLEEQNPPDGSVNFPEMLQASDMPYEQDILTEDEMNLSDVQTDEDEAQVAGAFDQDVTATHFRTNTKVIKPGLVAVVDENLKPVPQDPYDPTDEGASKGGRHKGERLHPQRGGAHLIPIIRMGENPEERKGLTVIKPWNS